MNNILSKHSFLYLSCIKCAIRLGVCDRIRLPPHMNEPHIGEVKHQVPYLEKQRLQLPVLDFVLVIELPTGQLAVHPTLDMRLLRLRLSDERLDLL